MSTDEKIQINSIIQDQIVCLNEKITKMLSQGENSDNILIKYWKTKIKQHKKLQSKLKNEIEGA